MMNQTNPECSVLYDVCARLLIENCVSLMSVCVCVSFMFRHEWDYLSTGFLTLTLICCHHRMEKFSGFIKHTHTHTKSSENAEYLIFSRRWTLLLMLSYCSSQTDVKPTAHHRVPPLACDIIHSTLNSVWGHMQTLFKYANTDVNIFALQACS